MTTVAVLADPPGETDALARLVESGVLDAEAATALYTATLRDACVAVERSGGDLLVNYRVPDDVEEDRAKESVATVLDPALGSPDSARYEVQVGSTRAARVGNTVTHLLEREGVRTAAVVDPTVALLERRHVDSAAMKLRGDEVVLGPTPGGEVWYAGFAEPVDFTAALASPALRTLTERATDDGCGVEFLESLPVVRDPAELASAVLLARTRQLTGKPVPEHTAGVIADLDLDVDADADAGGLRVHAGQDTDRT